DADVCLTSVILLADPDGRVGRVGVVSHAPGSPSVDLTNAGDVGGASDGTITRSTLLPSALAQLQQTTLNLRDAAAADQTRQQADEAAREIAPAPAPGPPPPPGPPGVPPGGLQQLGAPPQVVSSGTTPATNSTPAPPPPPPPPGAQAVSVAGAQAP